MRWAFPTAIDYYEVLRPHVTTSGTSYPSLFAETSHMGSLVLFDMFLPELRPHLYTGGLILTVTPLYSQVMPTLFEEMLTSLTPV